MRLRKDNNSAIQQSELEKSRSEQKRTLGMV